jgi:hypothetical protein
MAWSAPMTAVAGATFTAAQFNQYVRDNLNQTAPALATTASQLFVSTGANAIATRVPSTASVATVQSTASTSFTDLATVGPAVTVTCGTIALVWYAAAMANSNSDAQCNASVAVSGATTVAANDVWALTSDGVTAGNYIRYGTAHAFTGLTAGSNTFTMKYRAGSATASYQRREIIVLPL